MVQLYVPKIYRMALAMLLQNLYSQGRENACPDHINCVLRGCRRAGHLCVLRQAVASNVPNGHRLRTEPHEK